MPDSDYRADGWGGLFPASLTMFLKSGELDESGTAAHAEGLINGGAHGIVVGGTSGEFIALTEVERRRLIDVAVEAVSGRVPLIVGTGYYSTAQTTELTRYAEGAGASGAIVILPYFQRPSEQEIYDHFSRISSETRIPLMVYNNPGNSAATAMSVKAIAGLANRGDVAAIKSTLPTVNEIHELRVATSPEFRVFYGSFAAPLEALAGGAHGWISGILNVVLGDALCLWHAIKVDSDLSAALRIWRRVLAIKLLYTESKLGVASDLAIYRGILRLQGAVGGYCRAPLRDLSVDQMEKLAVCLADGLNVAVESQDA